MSAELLRLVESTTLPADQIAARMARIREMLLATSKYIDRPNFIRIHTTDLEILFREYDREFFDGLFTPTLGTTPLDFKLSKRLTSSGGKMSRRTERATGKVSYAINISSTILYACFDEDDHRPITVNGIPCKDRLDALQRVFEHEITHLLEMLLWNKSSCSQPRFHSITLRLFGHTFNKHEMITPREKALVKFGIKPGTAVRFLFEGVAYAGIVNRIANRATVLVEDPAGTPYSNGKKYRKFYVPVQMLKTAR